MGIKGERDCLALGEFFFQLFDGGERTAEILGQRIDELGFPLGDADGFFHVAQGVFHGEAVVLLTEQETDGGLVVFVAHLRIDRRKVEIHFAGELGFEGLDLEIDYDEAAEFQMIEKQIEVVVLSGECEVNLAANKGEADTERDEEFLNVVD
jgi:hypothetical protein